MPNKNKALLGNIDFSKRVHIVGGGFSGLILAYHFKKNNIAFTLSEKDTSTGGKIGTLSGDFGKAETGAHAFFASEEMIREFESLGLIVHRSQKKLKKKLYRDKKFTSLPLKLTEIFKLIFNLLTKKLPSITDKTTVDDFLIPLVGKEVSSEALSGALVGVYAADTNQLNLKSIFRDVDFNKIKTYREFVKQFRKRKSGTTYTSISFEGGMGALIKKLSDYLAKDIETESLVQVLQENSIICTSAQEAADLIKTRSSEIADQLQQIKYLPVTACTLITETELPELRNSFGALFPPRIEKRKLLGILNNYAIFPQQQSQPKLHSYTFILNTIDYVEDVLLKEIQSLKRENIWQDKKQVLYKEWPQGFPFYDHNRLSAIDHLKTMKFEDFALFGNYIDGISLREIYLSAQKIAHEVKNESKS